MSHPPWAGTPFEKEYHRLHDKIEELTTRLENATFKMKYWQLAYFELADEIKRRNLCQEKSADPNQLTLTGTADDGSS